jgi:hypothetical protein
LSGQVRRQEYPWWVQIGLWGLPSRGSVWAFVWICVLLAMGSVAYGFIDRRFFLGILFLLAALWYWLAIRWVDDNGVW